MGKTASRFTQSLGFGGKNPTDEEDPATPKPPQWDTTIDQLFGDAPPDDNDVEPPPVLDVPTRPKRRRRPPPPPPSMFNRGRRRPLPSSPGARRRGSRGTVHPMRTPIVPDLPRRVAKRGGGGVHAVNAPFGVNRRPMVLPAPAIEREIPARVVLKNNFKRRPSSRRIRPLSQRNQRLQELLQCPVCLTPYIEPRLLPCGHTYCDQCLNRLIQNDNDVVTCPECRKQHIVPDDGVFPSNFVVRNLLEEQGISPSSRVLTSGNLLINNGSTAKCPICETFAPLRLCRHCNFMVCDRCLRAHRLGSNNSDEFLKRSSPSSKIIQFYVAVRKINRTNSQVKRLTIDMPIGNYLRDPCETLIRRISEREQLEFPNQLVLEFGDKRIRPQRTLASYGVQNGDLLFLFNPDQRLHFLAYEDDESLSRSLPAIPQRENGRLRSSSFNSSTNDIRTSTTSNDMFYNREHQSLSPISDEDNYTSSNYSEN